jgi:hypothetical protein
VNEAGSSRVFCPLHTFHHIIIILLVDEKFLDIFLIPHIFISSLVHNFFLCNIAVTLKNYLDLEHPLDLLPLIPELI